MFKNLFSKKREDELTPQIDLTKILPIIKGTQPELDSNVDVEAPINRPLIDNLHVFYALNGENELKYINESMLKAIGKSEAELDSLVINNLQEYVKSKGVNIDGDENLQMIKLDQVIESSLLLYDGLWTKFCIDYQDDIVIAVPSREILIITLASNEVGINQLKAGAIDLFNSGQYKLTSNLLLKRLDGTFKKLDE
ncbi:DUF1444 family protein [uncultured Arcticibacterium sp.]|uniref:DUF1444 family protein n=1 Tax=uncultured Arcticibacterium sp. TaxID=2173042 RepID=UPI0030F5E81E